MASSSARVAVGSLLLLGILAYANVFGGTFLFDDRAAILGDPRLDSPAAFARQVFTAIRPLAKATFLLDRSLYGTRPAGYHLLNLLLHLASGVLVYGILRHPAFRRRRNPGSATGQLPASQAWWTAAVFLVHPIGTETVTYISGRPTGLMSCLYLAAFLAFLEARHAGGAVRRIGMTGVSAACLALSLLSKEVAIVFPALLAAYEWVVARPRRAELIRALTRVHLPLAAVVLAFLGFAAHHARYEFLFGYAAGLRPWRVNLITQANTIVYALSLLVLPGRLNFDHDLPIYSSLSAWPTPWSLVVLAALAGSAVGLTRRAPLWSFGILWFLLHVLPTNSFLPRYDLLSERNLYLASIGLYLSAASVWCAVGDWLAAHGPWQRLSRQRAAVAQAVRLLGPSVVVLGLLGACVARNVLYADPVAFWSDAVRKSPGKARPHTNLGQAWFERGDTDRAIEEFRAALARDPLDPIAQRNLLAAWRAKTASTR